MFRNILVPLDGSTFGEQALRYAILTGRATAARLHLVTVQAENASPTNATESNKYIETAADFAAEELDESISFSVLSSEAATRTRTQIASILCGYIRTHDIDLVVMTTHGRGAVTRSWLGSVADGVVRMSSASVLLIRPRRTRNPRAAIARGKMMPLVIALDGSKASETAIEPAITLAEVLGAEVTLVHVIQTRPVALRPESYMACTLHDEFLDRERDARFYLHCVAARLERGGTKVRIATFGATDVAFGLRDYVKKKGVGILAMSTSGWSAPLGWLLGSVADKVVRTSDIPILIVSPEIASRRVVPRLALSEA